MSVWQGDLMNGSGTIAEAPSGAFGAARRVVGLARRGAERQDEPRGADRGRVGRVLRDGALERAREGAARRRSSSRRRRPSRSSPGEGITKGALTVAARVPGLDEDGVRGRRRGREAELPGVEGARRRARRDARSDARLASYRRGDGRTRRPVDGARPLLRGGAGAHVRPVGLQRPPRGGRGRPAPEGARGAVEARAAVEAGARRPRSMRAATPSSPRWSPTTRPRSARLEEELKLALAERDPADDKDVIVEIRGGVGGDEAALWAGDLATDAAALRRAARLQVGGDRGDARARAAASRRRRSRSRATARTRSSSTRAGRTACSACPRRSRRAGSTRRPRPSR